MFDNDSKDGQKASTPSTGLRASNTLETLRPREVNAPQFPDWMKQTAVVQQTNSLPLQGRGLPPLDYEEPQLEIQYSSPPDEYLARPTNYEAAWKKAKAALNPEIGNVLPVDWPEASKAMKLPNEFLDFPLSERVTRLEEQVDGLLDRIAIHNVRSGHKI